MIHLKSDTEIAVMKEGGKRLKEVMQELVRQVTSGITTLEIDQKAEALIRKQGGTPSFQTVPGYKWTTCVPVNEQAVHTPPSKRILKEGDILTIDIGMLYEGWHTDYAITLPIGEVSEKVNKFLKVGKETLYKGIEQARVGNRLGHISKVIQDGIYSHGYFILKDLTGHGIGRKLHEDPFVFNYVDRPVEKTYKIQPGLVVAIEVIYSMGSEEIAYESPDKWSIVSSDRSLTACFEHTVAITQDDTYILT